MTSPPRPLDYCCLAAAVVGLSLSASAHALRFDSSLAISPSITFTDNICASKDNKKADFVGTATPSGRVSIGGKQGTVNLSGYAQFNTLTNTQLRKRGCGQTELGEDRGQFKPNIRASGGFDLKRKVLRVNWNARANQNNVNSRLAGEEDAFDRSGNRNNWFRYSIAPSFNQRVGSLGTFNLRYSYDELFNDKNKANDSVRHVVSAAFNGKSGGRRFNWGLSARHSEVEYDNPNSSGVVRQGREIQSAKLKLGYQFGRVLGLNGNIGKDFNNLRNKRYNDDGIAWQLNLRWTPTRRTSVSVGSGDRFFGKTPTVRIKHNSNRGSFSLGYNKKIRFDRDIRTSDDGVLNDFGTNDSLQSQDPLIDERLSLSYNHRGGASNITIAGYYSEQTNTETNQQGNFKNLGITYQPQLSGSYSLSFLVNWNESQPRQNSQGIDIGGNASQVWTGSASLSRPINNRVSSSLSYQYIDRSTDSGLSDYAENRIVVSLSISL